VLKLEKNEITIIKIGGSVLTDKNQPFSVRKKIIDQIIDQIIKSRKKIILIHGGGSYGHPLAKKFSINSGVDKNVRDQILGLAETHKAMESLNSKISEEFLKRKVPTITIHTSSIFLKNMNKSEILSVKGIELLLNLNVIPILYGDIILDLDNSFSIISGDEIILEICKKLQNYKITKVIFCIEEDGLFVHGKSKPELIKEISFSDLNKLNLAEFDKKIDVTGGIAGKLAEIESICKLGIPVQLLNGLKQGLILKSLNNEEVRSTKIN